MRETNSHIWAFDLGKGSIGEAVRQGNKFLHKASLLIPPDFAETKTAAGRRRMWRTRQAHKAREAWLDEVMRAAGIPVLHGRRVTWNEVGKKWDATPGDPRLEREFPADGDSTCYTSCLLRIKLLRGEKLEPWQIYKALHSAIQRRGYGTVPWKENASAARAQEGQSPEYLEARGKWDRFIQQPAIAKLGGDFRYPCYFDAFHMQLWSPQNPKHLGLWCPDLPEKHGALRVDCSGKSTRNVVFPADIVEKEIIALADAAEQQLRPALQTAFDRLMAEFKEKFLNRVRAANTKRKAHGKKLIDEPQFQRGAETVGEFIAYGPGGRAKTKSDERPIAAFDPEIRKHTGLRPGTTDDWKGVLGQKIPRFENRILNACALIPRLHVCRNPSREGFATLPPEKLLPAQVTFLMKLKNMRVEERTLERKQRGLRHDEIKEVFDACDPKRKYNLTLPQWKKWCEHFAVLPITGDLAKNKAGGDSTKEEKSDEKKKDKDAVEAPSMDGRSRFSRPALQILKELILSGEKPSAFHQLVQRDAELLNRLKAGNGKSLEIFPDSPDKQTNEGNKKKGLLVSDLQFLLCMRKAGAKEDSWNDLFIPNQRLDQVVQEISATRESDGRDAERKHRAQAIGDLIGSQNDPVVRHRLTVFWERLQTLEKTHDVPGQIVLEFVREDFMGQKAKDKLKKFQDGRAAARKKAREYGGLKYELWEAQGGVCLYGKQAIRDGKCVYLEHGLPLPNTPGWDDLVIDHIVPREAPYNGPDATVNYVLTTNDANSAKRKRSPYDWFHQDRNEEWDFYKQFVQSKVGTLGGKKVQLLTRSDAADLVSKYTSLAETAWISKLAQTLARLHFGWPLDHERGQERITVVPGGLTGRIRRKYLLNTLLDERFKNLPTSQIESENEEVAEKDRTDKRHHALDAMLISFFPDWMRNPKKDDFFRFPSPLDQPFPGKRNKHAVREYFRRLLDGDENNEGVLPENLFLEKAKLAEMAYGRSFQPEESNVSGETIEFKTSKIPLTDLAYSKNKAGEASFDYKQACRLVNGITDNELRKRVSECLKSHPGADDWAVFCKKFEEAAPKAKPGKPVKIEVRQVVEIRTRRRSVKEMAYDQGNSREYNAEYAKDNVKQIVGDSPEQAAIKVKLDEFFANNPNEQQWKAFAESLKPIELCKLRAEPDETGKKTKARTVKFQVFAHRPILMKFNLEKAYARIEKICDEHIRRRLRAFVTQTPAPDQSAWNSFCESFAQERKDDKDNLLKDANGNALYGAAIKKVRVNDGTPDEYKDFSKDGTGTFRKNKKEHKGQFVYVLDDETPDGEVKVRPVYVFESVGRVKQEVEQIPKLKRLVGYFQSGCTIEIDQPVPIEAFGFVDWNEEKKKRVRVPTSPLAPGKFLLKTIITKKRSVEMETASGVVINSTLAPLIKAGLRRITRNATTAKEL